MKWMLFTLPCFLLSARPLEGAPAAYFDAVDKTKIPPMEFTVLVTSTQPGQPAAEAGLQKGDFIAGVGGLRARCRHEIVLLRRQAEKNAEEVVLNVIRENQWLDITVPNRHSTVTWTGFGRKDGNPKTAQKLLARGVAVQTLPGYGAHPVTGVEFPPPSPHDFDFDIEKLGPGVQPWHALASTNHRMQEALLALLEQAGGDHRAWAESLLRAMNLLLLEEYGAAAEILAPLLDRKTGTFLDAVAEFYAAVARERGTFAETEDWRKCGVDEFFFAICYPWPTIPKKTATRVFGFDPELQDAYNHTLLQQTESTPEGLEMARKIAGRPRAANAGLEYRALVASGLIDPPQMGGWPFRASILSRNPGARAILEFLKEDWEKNPEARNMTAIAMLVPSIRTGDEDAFRLALRHIYDEMGYAEVSAVHNLLRGARSWWKRYGNQGWMDALDRLWDEEEARAGRPAVYDWLASRSVVAREWMRRGFLSSSRWHIRDAANFCHSSPWFIAEALQRADAAQSLAQMSAPAHEFYGLARRGARERLALYVENFHWIADVEEGFPRLNALMRRIPQDEVFRAMLALVGEQGNFYAINGVNRVMPSDSNTAPWMEWITQADEASFLIARGAAKKVRDGADPGETLEAALRQAATPAALLALARAAADAGEAGLAEKYRGMAERFHRQGRVVAMREPQRATALWGARAFLLEPGHEEFARQLLDAADSEKTRAWHLLGACHAYRTGDYAEAKRMCERAQSAETGSWYEPDTLFWDGEILSLGAYARKLEDLAAPLAPEAPPPEPPVRTAPGWEW